jgi:simple sugar transport system ATP-binding protein
VPVGEPSEVVLRAEQVSLTRDGVRCSTASTCASGPARSSAWRAWPGNGQRELAEVLAGVVAPTAGRIEVNGEDIAGRGPVHARRLGLAFVPEDRSAPAWSPTWTWWTTTC